MTSRNGLALEMSEVTTLKVDIMRVSSHGEYY